MPLENLVSELQPLLASLRDDLLERIGKPTIRAGLELAYRKEQAAQRTADPFEIWCRGRCTQVAAAWVLSVVFVRTLEDRGLIERRRIAGPGAEDSEEQFVSIAPFLTKRDYLLTVFRELGRLPGVEGVFDARHNPVWVLAPSGDGARRLLDFFRRKDEGGALRFSFEGVDTRFLGDLYQDLDAEVRSRYALLQTPDFVESFILDGTLSPAIQCFGLKEVRLIDPTCGSGHFLLGAFRRLFLAWRSAEPAVEPHVHALRAMGQVFGADLNPHAVAIARFRLTLAFLEVTGIKCLEKAPPLAINVCVADSLLHGTAQTLFSDRPEAGGRAAWGDDLFALEDEAEALRILGARYHAVVGNPPYITEKDRARRELYRAKYESAAGKFALAAPFTERFFELACAGGRVGMINANSFMKREFGKALIEKVLPRVELTDVVDTSGAFIPGHGTPTVILFGKNDRPGNAPVLAVMGKRGEPSTPEDPAKGLVWSSIRDHHREVGFENEYVSVAEVERERFAKHPWSLGGGGAAELKELLEERAERRLGEVASIGVLGMTNADDCMLLSPAQASRLRVEQEYVRPLAIGEEIRDWSNEPATHVIYPYDWPDALLSEHSRPGVFNYLWPYRTTMAARATFDGGTYRTEGLPWWKWHQVAFDRLRTPLSIALAFVATHNHFVLDRGGKVFNRSAPIIKLPESATEEDHLALLGYLNSSTACFWMKQVFFPKYGAIKRDHPDPARNFYEFAGTGLAALPVPRDLESIVAPSRAAEAIARERSSVLSEHALNSELAGVSAVENLTSLLQRRWVRADQLRRRLVGLQEEIDWRVYVVLGLAPASTRLMPDDDLLSGLSVARGQRPFEIRNGRTSLVRSDGRLLSPSEAEVETSPIIPLPDDIERVFRTRIDVTSESSALQMIETPVFKRLWRDTESNQSERDFRVAEERRLVSGYILDRAEEASRQFGQSATAATTRSIAGLLEQQPAVPAMAAFLTGESSPDLQRVLTDLIGTDAVPHSAALRYTETGLEKRAAWERTWDLQRREDAGEKLDVPVPPKYDSKDFRDQVYWRHRGKLDVPKERFISYPGAESDDDPSPLVGWAGWDHLQQASALAALYQKRKDEDGWEKDRLTPLLAGLLELVPWLKQWHNEPDPNFGGLRQGDFFETFVLGEARRLGLTADDLKAWRPAARRRPAGNGAPRATRAPRASHTPDDVLQAMATLDTGDGVEQRALAKHLGASGPAVGRLAQALLDAGKLELLSARPKRFKVVTP